MTFFKWLFMLSIQKREKNLLKHYHGYKNTKFSLSDQPQFRTEYLKGIIKAFDIVKVDLALDNCNPN